MNVVGLAVFLKEEDDTMLERVLSVTFDHDIHEGASIFPKTQLGKLD